MPKRYFGRNCWWIGGGFKIVLERAEKRGKPVGFNKGDMENF